MVYQDSWLNYGFWMIGTVRVIIYGSGVYVDGVKDGQCEVYINKLKKTGCKSKQ